MTLPSLIACATCFGAPGAAQTEGQNWGIVTLLVITGAVLACFIGMIVCLARRAQRFQAAEEMMAQVSKPVSEVG